MQESDALDGLWILYTPNFLNWYSIDVLIPIVLDISILNTMMKFCERKNSARATPGFPIRFFYNLAGNVIRFFIVFKDTTIKTATKSCFLESVFKSSWQ